MKSEQSRLTDCLAVWSVSSPRKLVVLLDGLKQLDAYLDRLGLDTGVLVICDQRAAAAPLEERTKEETATSPNGRSIRMLRT